MDRELEADRRAARITGRPLAVASSLLKVCKLMKRRHPLGTRLALGFLKPKGRIKRRVTTLVRLADGRASTLSLGDSRTPFLVAACLVCVLGFQAGERITSLGTGQFAIVWGADPAPAHVWRPAHAKTSHVLPKPGKSVGTGLRARLLNDPALRAGMAIQVGDLPKWVNRMERISDLLGVPPGRLGWEIGPQFRAEPLLRVGGQGIYQLKPSAS
jgi:hypothetical protein